MQVAIKYVKGENSGRFGLPPEPGNAEKAALKM
jgi:hypothetical protein